jgi:hypothetical protein
MSELIPAGQYKAVAIQQDTDTGAVWAQLGYSSKGTPQVIVHFEIIEHETLAGRRIFYFGYLSEASADYALKNLRTCGFTGDDLATLPGQAINNIVQITVNHDKYEGKTTAKIDFINPPFAGIKIVKPMVGADLARFAATLKAKLKGIPAVAGEKIGGKKQTSFASETGTNSVALSGEMPDLDL